MEFAIVSVVRSSGGKAGWLTMGCVRTGMVRGGFWIGMRYCIVDVPERSLRF